MTDTSSLPPPFANFAISLRNLVPYNLAVGVIAGNPFEVLKVRLQTAQTHASPSSSTFPNSPRVGKSSTSPIMLTKPSSPKQATLTSPNTRDTSNLRTTASAVQIPSTNTNSSATPSTSTTSQQSSTHPRREKPSIMSLYRSEGFRFFFAGAAGPILGLAFIDSAFFGLYGRVMYVRCTHQRSDAALTKILSI